MNKALKILLWILGAIGILVLIFLFIVGPYMRKETKKASPEQTINYSQGDLQVDIFYCSPSKKGRVIFGDLVPYGEVWRTGANEASTFTTNKDLIINGKELPKGAYTLWTIPDVSKWKVIFNNKMYGWGVKLADQKPSRDPDFDVLIVEGNVAKSYNVTENFAIKVAETDSNTLLTFAWDDVVVPLTMEVKD